MPQDPVSKTIGVFLLLDDISFSLYFFLFLFFFSPFLLPIVIDQQV